MIYKLFNHLNKDFKIIEILPQKPTARCPFSAIVEFDNEKKYVVIASTDIQKFYLKRSIEKQKEFYDDFSPYFKFNFPDLKGDLEDFSYAIYPYIENLKWCKDERPLKIIEEIYSSHAKIYKMSPKLLTKIQEDFLSSWPNEFHKQIKQLPLFKEYFDKIASKKEVIIYKEHCDYTVNNILDDGENLWLMDFEFAKDFQVEGHDEHDYLRTINKRQLDLLAEIKEKLMDKINDIVDLPYQKKKKEKVPFKQKFLWSLFAILCCLLKIFKNSTKLTPLKVDEGYDRHYILDYVKSALPYINGQVLEFNGQVKYSDLFDKTCKVYYTSYIKNKQKFPDSDFYIDIQDKSTLPQIKFDCIVATQLIYYFSDALCVLKNLKTMLKKDGIIVLTVPGPCFQDLEDDSGRVFYTKLGLKELCTKVFGEENVFNLKTYGSFDVGVSALLGLKKMYTMKNNKNDNISCVVGICCVNKF